MTDWERVWECETLGFFGSAINGCISNMTDDRIPGLQSCCTGGVWDQHLSEVTFLPTRYIFEEKIFSRGIESSYNDQIQSRSMCASF